MNRKNSNLSNKGDNPSFWKGKEVEEYDKNQKMCVEHKDEVLDKKDENKREGPQGLYIGIGKCRFCGFRDSLA